MEYYQEITLLPCAEVSLAFLWTKVFTQLHIAFADEKIKADITPMPFHFLNTGKQIWEKNPCLCGSTRIGKTQPAQSTGTPP